MGNLCSIFHSRFKNLMQVIPHARQAQLMDYLLLGWQTSTYRLKNSEKKWFMKPYSDIIADTHISESSLQRYIKAFADEGFIVRRQALYSRTEEEGGFAVKKGTYIYITDKLLSLLKPSQPPKENPPQKATPTGNENETGQNILPPLAPSSLDTVAEEVQPSTLDVTNNSPSCLNSFNNEGTGPLKMRESYIRDLYPSKNNIIAKRLETVDKEKQALLKQQFQSIQTYLHQTVKEELSMETKKTVAGIFFNLTFEHQKTFSSPQKLVAEYLYALRNDTFHLPHVRCFKHRNNILAKLLRTNQWRTPKGFHQHDYLGRGFKDAQALQEERWQAAKTEEINGTPPPWLSSETNAQLLLLEQRMNEVGRGIKALTETIYEQACEEDMRTIREQIETLKATLRMLSDEHWALQQEEETGSCVGWT